MNNIVTKNFEKDRFDEALSFVWGVFQSYEAPAYLQEGVDEFYKSIHDENYLSMLSMFGAFLGDREKKRIRTLYRLVWGSDFPCLVRVFTMDFAL